MADAIEYIRSIDWASLTDSEGNAADLPEDLVALTSTDADKRDAAYESLINRLVHAGSRYGASPYAVPYLLQLANQRATPDKGRIFYLLSLVAVGEDYEYLSGSFEPWVLRRQAEVDDRSLSRGDKGVGDPSPGNAGACLPPAPIELDCYDAVMRGIPLFCDLLTSSDPTVRSWASCMLGYFPERAADSMSHLRRLLEVEREPLVAATAAISSGLISEHADVHLASLLDRRLRSTHPLEIWSAAIGLAWCFSRSDLRVTDALSSCIGAASAIASNIPFNEGNIAAIADMAYDRILR